CLRPDRPRGTQIRDSRRCCRAKHDLARNGTATDRVPHRLGCDTVAAAIHVPFEHMHIFHVAQFRLERKRRTIILWHWSLARCPSVVQECEGRARSPKAYASRGDATYRRHGGYPSQLAIQTHRPSGGSNRAPSVVLYGRLGSISARGEKKSKCP